MVELGEVYMLRGGRGSHLVRLVSKAGGHRLRSILMPVYHEARTLRSIVARVLKSVDTDLELICVADCSFDNCLAILGDPVVADHRIDPQTIRRRVGDMLKLVQAQTRR